jgi:hypothetical protein
LPPSRCAIISFGWTSANGVSPSENNSYNSTPYDQLQ